MAAAKISGVFAFFFEARNLNLITPEWICFQIKAPMPVVMNPGLLIDYRLHRLTKLFGAESAKRGAGRAATAG